MSLQEQIAQMRREIEQWQKDPSGSTAMKRQLQALQSELDNLVKRTPRADRRRPRLAVVKPTPPPQVELTPDERAVWSSFLSFHKALLQYSGWVNRTEWLQMADVAADMTGGNPMLSEEFPSGPGIWVWDGTSRLWIRTHGIPFPTHDKVWGWDGDEQRWVKIEGGDGEMGVTDGSNAAPGRVGEYIAVSNLDGGGPSLAGLAMGPYQSLGSLTLTAGDWLVGGQIDAWLDVAGSAVVSNWGYFYLGPNDAIWANTDVASDRAWALFRGDGGDAACFNMGPIRISSAAPTQIIFQGQVGASAAVPWGCDYVIWARRVR